MSTTKTAQSLQIGEGKRNSCPKCLNRRLALDTQDSTQELKRSQGHRIRSNRFLSLFSSRKRSSSPLCPPQRWSFPTLLPKRRAMPMRRRSFKNSSSRKGFSTASLDLELQRGTRPVLDHQSSSTSLASVATIGAIEEVWGKGTTRPCIRRIDHE